MHKAVLRKAQASLLKSISIVLITVLFAAGTFHSGNAYAQAVLNGNQIKGRIEFTNQNQEILDILSKDGEDEGFSYAYLRANSVGLTAPLSSWTHPRGEEPNGVDYELTVESSASGIEYEVLAEAILDGSSTRYWFEKSSVDAVYPEPAEDITLNFQECIGLLDITWVDQEGNPIAIQGGYIWVHEKETIERSWGSYDRWHYRSWNWRMKEDTFREYHPVQGDGDEYRVSIVYEQGKDIYNDKIRFSCERYVVVNCDEIVPIVCKLPEAGELGQISGTMDMLGEDEHRIAPYTRIRASNGPNNHYREGLAEEDGSFTLPNMVPSDAVSPEKAYLIYGEMIFRKGRRFQFFRTPYVWQHNAETDVVAGQTTDLGDTFVIDPGYVKGKIYLAGPPSELAPTFLRHVYRDSDNDRDGDQIPDYYRYLSRSVVTAHGHYQKAQGATMSASGGWARTIFEGDYKEDKGVFEGDYELALGGLKRETTLWTPSGLVLYLYDPEYYKSFEGIRHQYLDIGDVSASHKTRTIVPGETTTADFRYCMSEVRLTYKTLSKKLYSPRTRMQADFKGLDFENRQAQYRVNYGYAYGYPTGRYSASDTGVVTMGLPQGSYTLEPRAYILNDSDSYSDTEFPEIKVDIGCGQVIELTTELQISLGKLPQTTNDQKITLYGGVNSDHNVVKLSSVLNGGEEKDICINCGDDPRFSTQLELEVGRNQVLVKAVDEKGNVSTVSAYIEYKPMVKLSGCDDREVAFDLNENGAPVEFDVTATGGCDDKPELSCSDASGSVFPEGDTLVECSAEDSCGTSASCEFTIRVLREDEDDDEDEEQPICKKGKVALCHIPPGEPENLHTIHVAYSAVKAHLAHGDELGVCPGDTWEDEGASASEEEEDDGICKKDKVLVCHLPADDREKAHTLEVAWSALRAHLDHGDMIGLCPDVDDDKGNDKDQGKGKDKDQDQDKDQGKDQDQDKGEDGDDGEREKDGGDDTSPKPDVDSDGDGVSDEDEAKDGTDPYDPGSFVARLSSPIYTLWNRALDMINVVELVNPSYEDIDVTISLFEINGEIVSKIVRPIPAQRQVDIILNDLRGFKQSPYGLVKIEFDNIIDGRVFYYRQGEANTYEYAFNLPLANASLGRSSVGFNTFQPSMKDDEKDDLVLNWLSIVNLENSQKKFVVRTYSQDGELLASRNIYVPAMGRADVDGGHSLLGASQVGLHEIVPADSGTRYIGQLMRYGADAPMGQLPTGYEFAFALAAKAGNGSAMHVPISRMFAEDTWLEVANTLGEAVSVDIRYYRESGEEFWSATEVLPAYGQRHYSATGDGLLAVGETGMAVITPSKRNSVIAQSMFYFREMDGSIAAMYGSQADQVVGKQLFGSYNLFLGMENWLKVLNTGDQSVEIRLTLNGPENSSERTLSIPARGSLNLPLHDALNFGTSADTYGVVVLDSSESAEIFSEVVRVRYVEGIADFAAATAVR